MRSSRQADAFLRAQVGSSTVALSDPSAVRRAMVVALAVEPARTAQAYRRFYGRALAELGRTSEAGCGSSTARRAKLAAYVEQVLVATLRPGDVVVLDNLKLHHDTAHRANYMRQLPRSRCTEGTNALVTFATQRAGRDVTKGAGSPGVRKTRAVAPPRSD